MNSQQFKVKNSFLKCSTKNIDKKMKRYKRIMQIPKIGNNL